MTIKRLLNTKLRDQLWLVPCLLAVAGCTAAVEGGNPIGGQGQAGSTGSSGGGAPVGTAGGSTTPGSAGSSGGTSVGGNSSVGGAGAPSVVCADKPMPARAPLRRLSQFEFNNTLKDLKLDSTDLALDLPAEDLSNGFGNDADSQSASSELIKKYQSIGETIAARVTAAGSFATLLPCSTSVTTATEAACAKTFVEGFVPKALRRPLQTGESDSFLSLFTSIRAVAGSTFASSIGAVVEAVAQDPAFIYRPEFGVAVPGRTDLLRPTGYEMATRLSYMLWGTLPDDTLRAAAAAGKLDTPQGVSDQATVMLTDTRAKAQVKFFFDNLLPIASLSQLERSQFPAFNAKLGSLMRQETETFLEHTVFDGNGGSWPSVFTADYTYVNDELAAFYGMSGVTGTEFRRVPVDTNKRLGLLSQAGMVAGTIHSNSTNPVVRGGFVVRKLLCQNIPLPTGAIAAMAVIPPEDANKTARDRFTAHSSNAVCHACHVNMDPVGFAFENYDPIGQWRDTENSVKIDPSGTAPALGAFTGPAELAKKMAESSDAQQCFAVNWVNYGYGRTLSPTGPEACVVNSVMTRFKDSNYNIQKLLLSLTQSDAFLYLPAVRE